MLRRGDPDGLRQLLLDHSGIIAARLRKDFARVLDDHEIEEAMSAMTVRIWKAAPRFDPTKGTLRAWASVIARNCALRVLEQRRRLRSSPTPDLDQHVFRSGAASKPPAERERLIADLRSCIAKLPPLQRAILEADLDAGDAVPAADLAALHGTSANSIYVSRQKGRKSLISALRARGHDLGTDPNIKVAGFDSA
ncbi:MAG: sigma-70 family RNA polymerase sigma factor [Planctomycetes bacterium]|nr:sigma-70 family RNA polymerase sigma factor [Planctomycetota bacterium]MCB9885870.1 sigma-70 family RNA polymerase sigma factor [Planctomycetota bacterium]